MLAVAAMLTLVSCGKQLLSSEELSAYVSDEEHGYTQKFESGGTVVSVTYRPTDLLVHQETGDEPTSAGRIDSLRQKYGQYYYFVLSLSHNNKEALHQVGQEQYSDMVNILSFRMNEFVTMTTAASDTIPVGDFMLNRTFGMSTSTDLLFVFNREKVKGKEWVQFNLNEFGLGVGNQRFRFKTKDLDEAPLIDFKLK